MYAEDEPDDTSSCATFWELAGIALRQDKGGLEPADSGPAFFPIAMNSGKFPNVAHEEDIIRFVFCVHHW